jgi:hypothetical protein
MCLTIAEPSWDSAAVAGSVTVQAYIDGLESSLVTTNFVPDETRDDPDDTSDAQVAAAAAYSALLQALCKSLAVEKQSNDWDPTHKQSPGLFDTMGNPLSTVPAVVRARTVILFEGGQWMWPGLRVGRLTTVGGIPDIGSAVLETLSLQPTVLAVRGFLLPAECDLLIGLSRREMVHSNVQLTDRELREALGTVARARSEKTDWDLLPGEDRQNWETLGWNLTNWEAGTAPIEELGWEELTDEQRSAALALSFDQKRWDGGDSGESGASESADSRASAGGGGAGGHVVHEEGAGGAAVDGAWRTSQTHWLDARNDGSAARETIAGVNRRTQSLSRVPATHQENIQVRAARTALPWLPHSAAASCGCCGC